MRYSTASALLLLGALAIGRGGWHARPPDAHAQSAGEGARQGLVFPPRGEGARQGLAFPPRGGRQGARQWPPRPPGGGWMLRHTCPPDTQHLAAWTTSGPPTAKADEIGPHSGPRPGLIGADHVRTSCVLGKLFYLSATPTSSPRGGWRLLPVNNTLAYTVVGRWRDGARLAVKSVRTPSQPAFRPSIESLALYAEPEAGALVPNTRLFRRPCDVPPAVSWAPPSAGAEKWEKWRKWPACQKYESDGPADCTVAFARRRRRRNDDDKGSISTFENQFSTRAPHNL